MRARKIGAVLLALGLSAGLSGAGAPVAQAARPRIYHTISSTFAGASATVDQGCLSTTVFLASARGKYAAQPGPVGKQTLTSVLVIVSNSCTRGFAAGGGGPVLVDAMGQTAAAPTFAPRLLQATLRASVPVYDEVSGTGFTVDVTATWTATGPLDHTTGHINTRFPQAGGVHSYGHDLRRAAAVSLSVIGGPIEVSAQSDDAVLELIRARCMEVVWPKFVGESYWCFGFPA